MDTKIKDASRRKRNQRKAVLGKRIIERANLIIQDTKEFQRTGSGQFIKQLESKIRTTVSELTVGNSTGCQSKGAEKSVVASWTLAALEEHRDIKVRGCASLPACG